MVWICYKCWAKNDYQVNWNKNKNCENCWAYLDYLDEKYLWECSEYWRSMYKKIRIIEFAVSRWYWKKWYNNIYDFIVRMKSLEPSICYKYFYLEVLKKWSNDIWWIVSIWGWNDFLMSKDFWEILNKYFEENPSFETMQDFNIFKNIYYEDNIEKKLFELLNLK